MLKKISKIVVVASYIFCVQKVYSSSYMCHFECSVGADGQTPWRKLEKINSANHINAHNQMQQKYYPLCTKYWLNSDFKIFGNTPNAWTRCEPAMPEKAGDIVGRNLEIPGAGWTGHIGIAKDANNIYEVMNERYNVIQYNSFAKFRASSIDNLEFGHYITIPWSTYWGATYKPKDDFVNSTFMVNFITNQKRYMPAYTLLATNTKVGKDGRECVDTNLIGQCKEYRYFIQAVYRCDSFVNEAYKASGNGNLVNYSSFTIPADVFNNSSILFKQRGK